MIVDSWLSVDGAWWTASGEPWWIRDPGVGSGSQINVLSQWPPNLHGYSCRECSCGGCTFSWKLLGFHTSCKFNWPRPRVCDWKMNIEWWSMSEWDWLLGNCNHTVLLDFPRSMWQWNEKQMSSWAVASGHIIFKLKHSQNLTQPMTRGWGTTQDSNTRWDPTLSNLWHSCGFCFQVAARNRSKQ